MGIVIQPYAPEHVPEVQAFNQRLAAKGAPEEYIFPENPEPVWLPRRNGTALYNEFFLALDGGRHVRGAYALKRQPFLLAGEPRQVTYYHHPFSEGIVDKEYTQVGLRMLMTVQRSNPLLYCLGMGGYDRPLPQMLKALKWKHGLIPFHFRVVRPARFLREIQALRRDTGRLWAARLAAASGLGWAALRTAQWWRCQSPGPVHWQEVPEFDDWTEPVWQRSHAHYHFLAVRTPEVLRTLYPAGHKRFRRLRVWRKGETAGWAVVTDTRKAADPQYGNLRVGWIVDALAAPENADAVLWAAWRFLQQIGVDLIQTNQSHQAWRDALERQGFWSGPSNFIFAATGQLASALEPWDNGSTAHINRADGDGLYPYEF